MRSAVPVQNHLKIKGWQQVQGQRAGAGARLLSDARHGDVTERRGGPVDMDRTWRVASQASSENAGSSRGQDACPNASMAAGRAARGTARALKRRTKRAASGLPPGSNGGLLPGPRRRAVSAVSQATPA